MQVTKKCPTCGEVKDIAEFPGQTNSYCRPCHNAYAREYRKANPDVHKRAKAKHRAANPFTPEDRRRILMRGYGITVDRFDEMLASQGGRCAICRTDKPAGHGWNVDHDHACCPRVGRSCGRCVRAILCPECNTGLGKFRDSPAVLRAAADYLERVKE